MRCLWRRLQEMAHPRRFRIKIARIDGVPSDLKRDALTDLKAKRSERSELLWVICHEPELLNAKRCADLCDRVVAAEVLCETELEVRVDGIMALLLERVGPNLIAEADPSPLLEEVKNDTSPLCLNLHERLLELRFAVASERAERFPCKAGGVYAREAGTVSAQLSYANREVLDTLFISENLNEKLTEGGGELCLAIQLKHRQPFV